jgi:transcription antitermination factor NusG
MDRSGLHALDPAQATAAAMGMDATPQDLPDMGLGEAVPKSQALKNYEYNQLIKGLEVAMSVSEERIKIAEKKAALGSGSNVELLQAKLDRNAQKSTLIVQRDLLNEYKGKLLILTKTNPFTSFAVDTTFTFAAPKSVDEIKQSIDDIRYVSGVSSLVHFGQKIPPIADEVIEELRQCFVIGGPMAVEDSIYPGAEVTVAEGAFMGSSGVVFRVLAAKQRVQILLDFLGRTTVTEVDRKSLLLENSSLADMMPLLATVPRVSVAGKF